MGAQAGEDAQGGDRAFCLSRPKSVATLSLEACQAEIARLRLELSARTFDIAETQSVLSHQKQTFVRALTLARMGVWECTLPENRLEWSDGVYDIFGLPRGARLERNDIAGHYKPASLIELERLRSAAIAEGTGFSFDAEIVTRMGDHRWIRITATAETEAGSVRRIFGTKQDITDEKIAVDHIRYLAAHDVMTGLANRSTFQERLAMLDRREDGLCLLLIDLDGFKLLNDTFGHAVGDDCLKETAQRLKDLVQDQSLVARIGGDEFAVIIEQKSEAHAVRRLAQKIVDDLRRTITIGEASVEIGASVGLAFGDGSGPERLVKNADVALYAAKAGGRNQFRVFAPPESEALGKRRKTG